MVTLVDAIRHKGEPRTEQFLDVPTPHGKLRLDLPGSLENIFANSGASPDDGQAVAAMIEESREKLAAGDPDAARDLLLEAVRRYPFALAPYESLHDLYRQSNPFEAEYYLKQLIALEPLPAYLSELARLHGQLGRLDEAIAIEAFLWEMRSELDLPFALSLASDYLVTLSRVPEPEKMKEVATQAINELGKSSRFTFQFIFAHVLTQEYAEARKLLDAELGQIEASDPIYPNFMRMKEALDTQGLQKQAGHKQG